MLEKIFNYRTVCLVHQIRKDGFFSHLSLRGMRFFECVDELQFDASSKVLSFEIRLLFHVKKIQEISPHFLIKKIRTRQSGILLGT